ncbi:hypothetical protein [Streptomyces bicolor]|uniref:hypothetical protein n=1 Tax=Streptomyces bicolor TaxID=66874 RepID=UPI001F3873B6|nr:hypothetical protein [Streptomyces bicolor]
MSGTGNESRVSGTTPPTGATEPSPETEANEAYASTARLFGPRGRHRRPRPRKALLAAGGLALAAGALSLVRLTPDSDVTGLGTPQTDPASDPISAPEHANNAAATVPTTAPKPSPSTTHVMGGQGATPTTATIVVPTANTGATPRPDRTAGQTPAPHRPAPTSQAPDPAPTRPPTQPPGRPTPNPPAPQPDQPTDDGVCVPVIGLCVDPLNN